LKETFKQQKALEKVGEKIVQNGFSKHNESSFIVDQGFVDVLDLKASSIKLSPYVALIGKL